MNGWNPAGGMGAEGFVQDLVTRDLARLAFHGVDPVAASSAAEDSFRVVVHDGSLAVLETFDVCGTSRGVRVVEPDLGEGGPFPIALGGGRIVEDAGHRSGVVPSPRELEEVDRPVAALDGEGPMKRWGWKSGSGSDR